VERKRVAAAIGPQTVKHDYLSFGRAHGKPPTTAIGLGICEVRASVGSWEVRFPAARDIGHVPADSARLYSAVMYGEYLQPQVGSAK